MSYLTQNEIAGNYSMLSRVAQAVTDEGVPAGVSNGDVWASENRRTWAAAPGWSEAWESAKVSNPSDPDVAPTYDPGADEGVITDGMILSQVQSMIGAE